MKKLIHIFIILLCYINGYTQNNGFPNRPTQGSIQTSNQNAGQWSGNRGISGVIAYDTASLNLLPYVKSKSFNIAHTTSDNASWYRSSDTSHWILFSGGSSPCLGTALLSGSVVWTGTALNFVSTNLVYRIICPQYFASAANITVNPANPSFPRITKFFADVTGNVGTIDGVPSANPQEPQINFLTQIDLGFIYVAAGATTPTGQIQTLIYNENIEWSGTSNQSGVNFASTNSPCVNTVCTQSPTLDSAKNISYQYGSTVNINTQQYLVMKYKPLSSFSSVPPRSLVMSFYFNSTKVTQDFVIANGAYGFNSSLADSCQLIAVPLTGIFTNGDSLINKLFITNNGAVVPFELDYIYLLQATNVPPVINVGWQLRGNAGTNESTDGTGTTDNKRWNWITNDSIRAYIPSTGIERIADDDLSKDIVTIDTITKAISRAKFPVAYGRLPIVIVKTTSPDSTLITCPTCATGSTAYTASQGVELLGLNFQLRDSLPDGFGTAARFMWVPSKKAIRAGSASSNRWDYDSIGTNSAAFGVSTKANGINSFALGNLTIARGTQSVALGQSTLASGSNSVAMGGSSIASGGNSFAMGSGAVASGDPSIALGTNTIASAANSVSIGNASLATGNNSMSIGTFNYSKSFSGTVVGLYNDSTDATNPTATDPANRIFQIGNGTADNARSNAMTVLGSGATQLNKYGSGTFTGTPTYNLSVDATGHLIETTPGISSQWTDTLTNGAITHTGDVYNNGNLQIVGGGLFNVAGSSFYVKSGGTSFLVIDPTLNNENSLLQAYNNTGGGNSGSAGFITTDTQSQSDFTANFNDGTKYVNIEAVANVTTASLGLTADVITLTGTNININGAIDAEAGSADNNIKSTGNQIIGDVNTYIKYSGSDNGDNLELHAVNGVVVVPLAGTGTRIVTANASGLLGSAIGTVSNFGTIDYQTPTTGQTISSIVGSNIIEPAGALLALTVNLPSSPNSGDIAAYTFTTAITGLTFGNGTVVNTVTTTAAGGTIKFIYYSGTSKWYKWQ